VDLCQVSVFQQACPSEQTPFDEEEITDNIMTDSQIIINIAKLEGWTSVERCNNACASYAGIPPDGSIYGKHRQHLRNYLEDLNAMHEAEATMNRGQRATFRHYIGSMFQRDEDGDTTGWEGRFGRAIHATSSQRAEAFLRTFNLWEDEA